MSHLRSMGGWLYCAAVAGLLGHTSVQADTLNWVTSGTTSFSEASNWNPTQVPGIDDVARFAEAGPAPHAVVVDAADALVKSFSAESGSWVFTVNDGRSLSAGESFYVRGDHSLRATLRGEGNYNVNVSGFSSDLTNSSGPFDRCTVKMVAIKYDGRGLLNPSQPGAGLFDVGLDGGGAIVEINAGSQVKADYIRVGEGGSAESPSQGNLKVSGAGTKLTGEAGMQVGAGYGWGEFVMDMGATADITTVELANFGPFGIANAVLSGNGTTLNVHHISVGAEGRGQLIMGDEAQFNANDMVIGGAGTADGQVTLEDAGTRVSVTERIWVGNDTLDGEGKLHSGKGLMAIDKSALVTTSFLSVGRQGYLKVAPTELGGAGGMMVISEQPEDYLSTLTPGTIHVGQNGTVYTAGTIEGNIHLEHHLGIYTEEVGQTEPTYATVKGNILVDKGTIGFDLVQNTSGLLTVDGTVTFGQGEEGWGWVNAAVKSNFIPVLGQSHTLLHATSIVGTPEFMWFNDGGLPDWMSLELHGDGQNLWVTVIPEPASLSLLLLAAGGMLCRRTRA